MRTRLVWIVFAVALLVLAYGLRHTAFQAQAPDPLTAEERSWVANHRVIRLAPDPAFPPIEFFDDDGQYKGITADLFRIMAERLQVKFEFVKYASWDAVLAAARDKQIDGITAAQITPERTKYLLFTRPILRIPNVIITRRSTTGTLSFESMAGMTVAVTKGYANAEYITTHFPGIKVVETPNDLQALGDVSFRGIDAAVVNLATASYLIEKNGFTNLRVTGDSGKDNALTIATRSDDTTLGRILDKGLAALGEREIQDVVRRWVNLGPPTASDNRRMWLWVSVIAGLVVVGMAGVLIWNQVLRRQVHIRTDLIRSQNEQLQQQNAELEEQGELLVKAQRDLQEFNAELEHRVAARTLQLELANQELEAFAYSVSHDLRTPLRAVDGFSFALQEDYGPKLDGEAVEFIARIRAGAQRMSFLIDDLLKLSRITQTQLQLESVDLSAVAGELVLEISNADPNRRVDWRIDPTTPVRADPSLMRIALQNLLDNSWKFTSRLESAQIQFGGVDDRGTTTYFVKDNGAGFDSANTTNLFAPFQRMPEAAAFPGTGIGLAIVQRIVRRHMGRIWAESSPNQGATFYFTLTDRDPQPPRPTALGCRENAASR